MSNFYSNLLNRILDPNEVVQTSIKFALEVKNSKNNNNEIIKIQDDIKKIVTNCTVYFDCDYINLNMEMTAKYSSIFFDNTNSFVPVNITFLNSQSRDAHKCVLMAMAYRLSKGIEDLQKSNNRTLELLVKSTAEHCAASLVEASIETLFTS